ncbi:hypothetical protein [Fulvimarina sp. MAC8]|uniref:hypothetical protein n=1 Tax=Fulvimarina sp. MAC8 TaxID=3162874 RepID=UPI0032F040DA
MPVVVATPTQTETEWRPREKDVKTYLHFDRRINAKKLAEIANNPILVEKNSFFPLLLYKENWVRFRASGRGKRKCRPIRYAARKDAAIYARYRQILSSRYEDSIAEYGISDSVIAYRRIPKDNISGNKSNIDFAKDAFDYVKRTGSCVVTVADISSYFENLDHAKIREIWEKLLDGPLPKDHEAVFKSITNYCTASLRSVQDRIEIFGFPNKEGNRSERRRRRIDVMRNDAALQLCTPHDFRRLVCGADPEHPSLLQKNNRDFGIPQGTPISDLIANFYLLYFDIAVSNWARARNGIYFRYSDDILIAIPASKLPNSLAAMEYIQEEIAKHGNHLKIKSEKVAVCDFRVEPEGISFQRAAGKSCANGLEYLGFRFDGRSVHIKDATLANAWRKLKRRSYGRAKRFVKQFRLKGDAWIVENYPIEKVETELLQEVSYSQDIGYERWTFLKYISRSREVFSEYQSTFSTQTSRYRKLTRHIATKHLNKAVSKYGKTAMLKKGKQP